MSDISGYINQIQTAVYGEQVRSSIVNALLQCYSDVNNPSLQTEGFTAALNAAYAGGILDIQTVTSFSDMTNDKIIYRYNGTAAGKQKGLYYYSALSDSWVLIGSEIQKVSLASQMTDVNDIYKYIGTETGMVQNSLYCHNGTAWVPIGSGVLEAATVAQMTNTGAIYKYTGNESGYYTNVLYYYNGTAWVRIADAVTVDPTLTQQGVPADARAVGQTIGDMSELSTIDNSDLVNSINEINGKTGTDPGLSLSGKAADAKVTGEYINSINEFVNKKTTLPILYLVGDTSEMSPDVRSKLQYTFIDDANNYQKTGWLDAKWQGDSSLSFPKKNYTLRFYHDPEWKRKDKIDFFGLTKQSKWVAKANYVDASHLLNIVSARLWGDIVSTRITAPPELLLSSPNNGAVNGMPILIYINGEYHGLYTLNIPKDDFTFGMDEDNPLHCCAYGQHNNNGDKTTTDQYVLSNEFRNPSVVGWECEVPGTWTSDTENGLISLISFVMNSTDEEFYSGLDDRLDVESALDYYIFTYFIGAGDSLAQNMILLTYDGGLKWYCSAYDLDGVFGNHPSGNMSMAYPPTMRFPDDYQDTNNLLWIRLGECFRDELITRYTQLRASVLDLSYINKRFENLAEFIPSSAYFKDSAKWPYGNRYSLELIKSWIRRRAPYVDTQFGVEITPELIPCTGISLNKTNAQISGSETLVATLTPTNCNEPIIWSSSAPSVAIVENGVVMPISNGTTVITAKCGNFSASCTIKTSIINITWSESATYDIDANTGEIIAGNAYISQPITLEKGKSYKFKSSNYQHYSYLRYGLFVDGVFLRRYEATVDVYIDTTDILGDTFSVIVGAFPYAVTGGGTIQSEVTLSERESIWGGMRGFAINNTDGIVYTGSGGNFATNNKIITRGKTTAAISYGGPYRAIVEYDEDDAYIKHTEKTMDFVVQLDPNTKYIRGTAGGPAGSEENPPIITLS